MPRSPADRCIASTVTALLVFTSGMHVPMYSGKLGSLGKPAVVIALAILGITGAAVGLLLLCFRVNPYAEGIKKHR
jgi:hypothetical protein